MAFKIVVLSCLLAIASAQYHGFNNHGLNTHAATSFSSISHGHQQQLKLAAPVAHYAAPIAHYSAPVQHYAAPIAVHQAPLLKKVIVEEQHAPAHYEFAYAVNDPHTGDIKEQKESRDGHTVKGMYSLVEADGSKRIVEYTADEHNGFQAVVHKEAGHHPQQIKAVPVLKTIAAPVYHAAPAVHYAAPVVKTLHAAPLLKAAPVAHYSASPSVSFASFSTPHFQIHH